MVAVIAPTTTTRSFPKTKETHNLRGKSNESEIVNKEYKTFVETYLDPGCHVSSRFASDKPGLLPLAWFLAGSQPLIQLPSGGSLPSRRRQDSIFSFTMNARETVWTSTLANGPIGLSSPRTFGFRVTAPDMFSLLSSSTTSPLLRLRVANDKRSHNVHPVFAGPVCASKPPAAHAFPSATVVLPLPYHWISSNPLLLPPLQL